MGMILLTAAGSLGGLIVRALPGRQSVGLLLPLLLAAGCNRTESPTERGGAEPAAQVAADNTKKNERDQKPEAVTPLDQQENEADLKITQEVRQGVVKQDALSMAAKNVKIITANGVVTLRGPVNASSEKAEIERIAKATQGVTRVENHIEIAAQ